MTSHTPGPWEFAVESNDHGGWINREQAVRIWCGATLIAAYSTSGCEFPDDDENEANARLIAAAPELLSLLERIRDDRSWRTNDNALWTDLLTAIAKATGATP